MTFVIIFLLFVYKIFRESRQVIGSKPDGTALTR